MQHFLLCIFVLWGLFNFNYKDSDGFDNRLRYFFCIKGVLSERYAGIAGSDDHAHLFSDFFKVKAYSFSVLFLLLELQFLREGKRNLLWLCILWANTHSGSVILFIGVYGAYVLFNKFKGIKGLLISSLGILINPYGLSLMVFNIHHALDKTMGLVITDWVCLDAGTGLGILVLALAVFTFYITRGMNASSLVFLSSCHSPASDTLFIYFHCLFWVSHLMILNIISALTVSMYP